MTRVRCDSSARNSDTAEDRARPGGEMVSCHTLVMMTASSVLTEQQQHAHRVPRAQPARVKHCLDINIPAATRREDSMVKVLIKASR